MRRTIHILKRKSGQSAIEFIIVVLVVFFFLFFFLSLSMLLVVSQYMDYATFMAARTYKSAFGSPNSQRDRAQAVFRIYSQKVVGNGLVKGLPRLRFAEAEPGNNLTGGVVVDYDIDLFYMPPIFVQGIGQARGLSTITLTSESYLGREVNNDECKNFFDEFSSRFGLGIEGTGFASQMEDNGC